MPDSVAVAQRQRCRDQCRAFLSSAAASAISRPCEGARAIAEAARAAGVPRLVPYFGHRRGKPQLQNRYISPRSGRGRHHRSLRERDDCGPAWFRPDDAMFNRLAKIASRRRSCPSWATAAPVSAGVRRRCRRRSRRRAGPTDTAKSVFELADQGLTYREIAALTLREIAETSDSSACRPA